MKKPVVVTSLVAIALAIAPFTSATAWGRHYGGGPVWGLANAVVATAVAVVTVPIAILAAVAQAPRYYASAAAPGYYGPPAATYYAPPPGPVSYAPPPDAAYYAPRVAEAYYGPPVAVPYDARRQAYYAPRPAYHLPALPTTRDRRATTTIHARRTARALSLGWLGLARGR